MLSIVRAKKETRSDRRRAVAIPPLHGYSYRGAAVQLQGDHGKHRDSGKVMTASASSLDRDQFLSAVRASGLLAPEQFERILPALPDTSRGRVIARKMVELGVLTRFQAERLLAGRTQGFLLGQYEILDQIGRGGMGRVFKARHRTMGRLVALKILSSKVTRTSRARDLFQREIHATAKLHHPNIVVAFDANEQDGRCYLVMEYVDGPNLFDLVKTNGPLPISQACALLRQAALGLQFAHDAGMVHRDIKPSNLLLQPVTGRIGSGNAILKILDFGLARMVEPDVASGSGSASGGSPDTVVAQSPGIIGTPDYIAPEQARDASKLDPRSDLYSLGCTFYFLLTGQVPFPGGTSLEKILRHGTEEPIAVDKLRPEVPAGVLGVVRKLMAKDVEQRFSNADVLIQTLDNIDHHDPTDWFLVEGLSGSHLPTSSSQPQSGEDPSFCEDSPWVLVDEEDGGTPSTDNLNLERTHPRPSTQPVVPARSTPLMITMRILWWMFGLLMGIAITLFVLYLSGLLPAFG